MPTSLTLLGQQPADVDLLEALSVTHHELVHAGLFPDQDGLEELQLLKWIFEQSVTALFTWQGILRDIGSLELLYSHVGMKSSELSKRQRLIAAIRRKRH